MALVLMLVLRMLIPLRVVWVWEQVWVRRGRSGACTQTTHAPCTCVPESFTRTRTRTRVRRRAHHHVRHLFYGASIALFVTAFGGTYSRSLIFRRAFLCCANCGRRCKSLRQLLL